MTKPVEIVTVSKIIPIYKDGQEANSINVINFNFSDGSECGYNVIAQKGLYEIGSKAVYIQPDYCLSDIKLFDSFIRPNGEINKSKLGKNFRIRAIKFNFQFENSTDPIYSFGILMPKKEVDSFLNIDSDVDDIAELLGVTKYEEPESAGSGLIKGSFPSFCYKTDEENIMNIKSKVSKLCDGNTELGISIKHDGCLDENTLIELGDNTLMSIKYICENKYNGYIKTYNIDTKTIELSKISNYRILNNNNDWYEIILENDISIKLTGNHRIWIKNLQCYRKVKDLIGNEEVLLIN